MSADASIDLELNAKPMYSELAVAERKFGQGMDNMSGRTGRLGSGLDGITVRTRAAGRQIHNFARDMASGADATTLLSDGLMGVGKSLGLSLGSIATLGIGAVVISKLHSIKKEYEDLQKTVAELNSASMGAQNESLSELEANLKKAADAMKKLREEKNAYGSTFLSDIGKAFISGGPMEGLKNLAEFQSGRDKSLAGAEQDTGAFQLAINAKHQRSRDIREDALGGEAEFITKAKKLQDEFYEKAGAGIDAASDVFHEIELGFTELAKSVAQKRRERVQRTLGEIAAIPEVATAGTSYEEWQSGQRARSAQQWDAYGESRRQAGDMQGAQDALNYSTDIKRSIPGLKDSEKDLKGEFKGALDESKVLQEIRDGVKKPLTNR